MDGFCGSPTLQEAMETYIRMASADVKRDSVTLRIITRRPSTDLVFGRRTDGREAADRQESRTSDALAGLQA